MISQSYIGINPARKQRTKNKGEAVASVFKQAAAILVWLSPTLRVTNGGAHGAFHRLQLPAHMCIVTLSSFRKQVKTELCRQAFYGLD